MQRLLAKNRDWMTDPTRSERPDLYQVLKEQVQVLVVQVQVYKYLRCKYKYKYFSRNSQVQITDQFVAVYNQGNFINQTSNAFVCFAISSLSVGRH